MTAAPSDRVEILASTGGQRAAAVLAERLNAYGVSAVAGAEVPGASRVVVVISADAPNDRTWCERVERLGDARVVPVKVGHVAESAVPGCLRELNWIPSRESGPDLSATQAVLTGLHSDLSRYRMHRSLSLEAMAWASAGRPDFLLVDSGRRARQIAEHVRAARDDRLAAPTAVIDAFVAASSKRARREMWRRVRRWGYRSVIAVVVAVAVAFMVVSLRTAASSSDLAGFGDAAPQLIANRPDRIGMLSAGVLIQPGFADHALARTTIQGVLGEEWSSGVLGSAHTSRLEDAVVTNDGLRTITFDGEGSLTEWDNASASVLWRRGLAGAGPLGVVDADPNRRLLVVASGKTLHVVRLDPWSDRPVPLPLESSEVALAPADGYAAVQAAQGALSIVPLDGGEVATSPLRGAVLDLRQTDGGHVRALVRAGSDLVVADPRSGAVVARAATQAHRFERGALGGDGSVAWTGPDRQIYYAPSALRFRPTGQAVPDELQVLQILPGARVAFGGAQFGVRVFDDRAGIEVGEICRTLVGVTRLAVSSGGDVVGCLDSYMLDLWRTAILSPLGAAPPQSAGLGHDPTGGGAAVQMRGSVDGTVVFTYVRPTAGVTTVQVGGAVTAVAASADGGWAAVGTRDGAVVQFAPGPNGFVEVGRWQTPTGSAVATLGNAAQSDRMLVQTADHLWWSPRACVGCNNDDALVADVRARLWGCYSENQVAQLTSETRARLGIQICAPSPPPGG